MRGSLALLGVMFLLVGCGAPVSPTSAPTPPLASVVWVIRAVDDTGAVLRFDAEMDGTPICDAVDACRTTVTNDGRARRITLHVPGRSPYTQTFAFVATKPETRLGIVLRRAVPTPTQRAAP